MRSLVNNRGSFTKDADAGEDIYDEQYLGTMFGTYFTKDCKKLGVADEDTRCTEYAMKIGKEMLELYNRCKTSKFVMVNNEYNRGERK